MVTQFPSAYTTRWIRGPPAPRRSSHPFPRVSPPGALLNTSTPNRCATPGLSQTSRLMRRRAVALPSPRLSFFSPGLSVDDGPRAAGLSCWEGMGECFSRLRIRFVQLHLGAQAAGDRLTGRKRKGSRQASGLQFFSSQRGRVLRNQSVRRAEIYIALPGNCTGRHWRKLAPARTASTI